jgi:hypothetical protein
MKNVLRLGYAAALLIAGAPAYAGGTNATQVSSTVTKTCQINAGSSSVIDLTGLPVNTPQAGTFNYQCNFAGGNVGLRFTSSFGGVKNGSDVANYGIFLNDQTPAALGYPSPSQWLQASNATGGGVPFVNISVPLAPNTQRSPYFYVGLTQPVTVAGTYTDTLTIQITP